MSFDAMQNKGFLWGHTSHINQTMPSRLFKSNNVSEAYRSSNATNWLILLRSDKSSNVCKAIQIKRCYWNHINTTFEVTQIKYAFEAYE